MGRSSGFLTDVPNKVTPMAMGPIHFRWKSSWPVLLLTASISSSCFLLTQAMDISVTPSLPLKEQDVTLTPGGKLDFIICNWYRGENGEANRIVTYIPSTPEQQNGPAFTERETAGPGCSLHIRSLTLDDTGIYIVSKLLPGYTEIGSVHIEVLEMMTKPTVSAFPCPYAVEFNDSVRLTCETLSGHTTVRWFKNGSPLGKSVQINLSSDNQTLSIPNITREHAGQYQCEVSDSVNTQISNVKYIDVIYGPEIPVIYPMERFYQEHSVLRLTCEADTFPDAHYVWFFNGMQCGTKSELLIDDTTPDHSGNYVCQAMNVLTLQKRNSMLEIEVEGAQVHDVTVTGPSIAIENYPVTLTCTSVGSSVSYSWFKGDQSLEPGHHIVLTDNNQHLTLNPSNRNDSGEYTCTGFNSISSSSSEPHRLDILYGPDTPIIHQIFDRVYSQLHLSCRADSSPAASIFWFLNGKLLPDQSSTLVLHLAAEYGGNYTCQAENGGTQQKRNTTLEIEVLGQWTSVKEC